MGYLTENKKSLLSFGFGGQQPSISPSDSAKKADLFMAINMTSIDLPVLEKYVSEFIQDRPLITWNLELDTLRSDLGAPLLLCPAVKPGFCVQCWAVVTIVIGRSQ